MSDQKADDTTPKSPITPTLPGTKIPPPTATANSSRASSIADGPVSKIKPPSNFAGSTGSISKIGRLCTHTAPKAGPPPREDTDSMSRESDDNLSSINSTYTDLYQKTVERFTRSSLSPEMDYYSSTRSLSSKSPTSSYSKTDNDRQASYHGSVLTADTEQFIIGQRVWVGGIRPGQIAYIGETHFAPGDWAGIVLDEPNGKNDGCVSGKRYFQCEPRRGIFSRLTRLTLTPLAGASIPTSPIAKNSPELSRTGSPTASIRSSFLRSPSKNGLTVGDRIIVSSGFGSRPGILRYLGETQFASGNWCGVELDEASGKNDGTVDGIRYFECKPKYGVFVPIAKVSLSPSSKKTRLSRTGSRESLTSIGTMNSIATTATSRMRMNAQRKSSLIKPVTTPKSQFSMQDILREKQNHIEQLMIERDLDRDDSNNQAMQFQKNISELKTRITQLEVQLEDERKKAEDLQFSVDEATFCGDELNAQTQVYKEKIQDLENKLKESSSDGAEQVAQLPLQNETIALLQTEIEKLTANLDEQKAVFEGQIAVIQEEEKRLLDNIKFLQTQNETLQKELLGKDESLEKFSLSESGIENLRQELLMLKADSEKERQQLTEDFSVKLAEKQEEAKHLKDELANAKSLLVSLKAERTSVDDDCQNLQSELKTRDEQLQTLNEQISKLSAELSLRTAESSTLNELLEKQKEGSAQEASSLEEKNTEVSKLREEIVGLVKVKETLEANLNVTGEEVKKLVATQTELEEKLSIAKKSDADNLEALAKLKETVESLKSAAIAESNEKQQYQGEAQQLKEANESLKSKEEELRKELLDKEALFAKCREDMEALEKSESELQAALTSLKQQSEDTISQKTQEIQKLSVEAAELLEIVNSLKGESSEAVQKLSTKLTELEGQNTNLSESLQKAEAAIKTKDEQLLQHSSTLKEKEAALKSTMASLESSCESLNKLKGTYETVLTNTKELEEKLQKSSDTCMQQQLQLSDLQRKSDAISAKCESLVMQNEHLETEIAAARNCVSEAQAKVTKSNEELQSKIKQFAESDSASNENRFKLESEIEELKQKLGNASSDYGELKQDLQKAKEDIAEKSRQLSETEEKRIKMELALSDALRQNEILQAKFDALAAQNEALQADMMAMRTSSTDSNAELVKLSIENAKKQKDFEEMIDKNAVERSTLESQLQASQQRIDALCKQVETLTQEIRETTQESAKRFELLKEEQKKSSKQELELSDVSRKCDSLSTKCANLEAQNESLQKELTTLRSTSTDSNSTVLKLTEELSAKKKSLQELTDETNAKRLQLESQLEETSQNLLGSRKECENLQNELKQLGQLKDSQSVEFENLKEALKNQAQSEIDELTEKATQARKKLIEEYEAQLKNADNTKSNLDEAISSLQQQIELLQKELLVSQLDFKAKQEEAARQLKQLGEENSKLNETLMQLKEHELASLNQMKQENAELAQTVQKITAELNQRTAELQAACSEREQLKLMQSNASGELSKKDGDFKALEETLAITKSDLAYKTQLNEEDQKKLTELKGMLEDIQASNTNMSQTNAQLCEALQAMEAEKYEMENIFELFEMEADQNSDKLIDKMTAMKTELSNAQQELLTKNASLEAKESTLAQTSDEMKTLKDAMDELQASSMAMLTELAELKAANSELKQGIAEKDSQKQKYEELEGKLNEYKKTIDEMDDAATDKTSAVSQMQEKIKELAEVNANTVKENNRIGMEYDNLKSKYEELDLVKTREILELHSRIRNMSLIPKPKTNGSGSVEDLKSDDPAAQINFLNSIIADMQKKNDTLKSKIEALETDFTQPKIFEKLFKRKPTPRSFCDICDVFDKHETEDCPLQASGSREPSPLPSALDPVEIKERILPEPRKYCEDCEMFGHVSGECTDESY